MKGISSLRGKTLGVFRLKKALPIYRREFGVWKPGTLPEGQMVTRTQRGFMTAGLTAQTTMAGHESHPLVDIKQRRTK